MNLSKKQRGQRRKLRALLTNIGAFVPFKATDEPYEHFHVPSSMFIESPKTSGKIKTAFCRKWLAVTEEWIKTKPTDLPFCKVVAVIDVPHFWGSQIILFYHPDYYTDFWNRNEPEQTWMPIDSTAASFKNARNIATTLFEKGYLQTFCDNDGYHEQSTLWFYGDL